LSTPPRNSVLFRAGKRGWGVGKKLRPAVKLCWERGMPAASKKKGGSGVVSKKGGARPSGTKPREGGKETTSIHVQPKTCRRIPLRQSKGAYLTDDPKKARKNAAQVLKKQHLSRIMSRGGRKKEKGRPLFNSGEGKDPLAGEGRGHSTTSLYEKGPPHVSAALQKKKKERKTTAKN